MIINNYEFDFGSYLTNQRHIRDGYDKFIETAASECGLTKPEADILLFIGNNPKHDTASDIVSMRGFSKAYVSKAIDSLLEKRLITSVEDKNDRRLRRLRIVPLAMQLYELLRKKQSNFIHLMFDTFTNDELEIFMYIIRQVTANVVQNTKNQH